MRQILILVTLTILLVIVQSSVSADNPITVTTSKFTNQFPRQLTFQVEAKSSAKITEIALIAQVDGIPSSSRQIPDFSSDLNVSAQYVWLLGRNYLPPGATGQYWWTIKDSVGNEFQSPKQAFRVEDSTQTWKKLSHNQLAMYWYAGGDAFGKALFDRAIEALRFLERDTGVSVDRQVQMWIYGNRNDFFRALEPGAKEWTGGRAFPDYGIIAIHIEPTQLQWGKEATAHELTHLVIHQKIKSPLGGLSMPHWMDEGLAMYYEQEPGTLDHQYSTPLKRAIQNDTLVPIRSFSGSFPSASAAANLAYAESWGVVDFIFRHYGREKMTQLLQAFKAGGHYDDIFVRVLGVDTDGLEVEWRKDIGAKTRNVPARSNATPTVVPTLGLSTDFNVPPATPTPQPVALNATPAPTLGNSFSAPMYSDPSSPLTTFCGSVAGLMALGIFGAARVARKHRKRL